MFGYKLVKKSELKVMKDGFNSTLDMYIEAQENTKKDNDVIDMAAIMLLRILDCYPHVFNECITKEEITKMCEMKGSKI